MNSEDGMSKEKPDGWVAQYKNLEPYQYGHEDYKNCVVGVNEEEIRRAFESRRGWRIRPVKLVFLDEEPKA